MLRKPLVNSLARKPCTTQKAFSRVPLLFANSKVDASGMGARWSGLIQRESTLQ